MTQKCYDNVSTSEVSQRTAEQVSVPPILDSSQSKTYWEHTVYLDIKCVFKGQDQERNRVLKNSFLFHV